MLKINELTEQEKSIKIKRLMGADAAHWNGFPNLYDPTNMALAWRVIGWAVVTNWPDDIKGYLTGGEVAVFGLFADDDIYRLPPAEAQAAWLDKILELAITAGLTTADEVTP